MDLDLNKLKIKALDIATKKGWNNGNSSKHYICLVISELMEAVEADRKNQHADLYKFMNYINSDRFKSSINRWDVNFQNDLWKGAFHSFIKDTVEDELADAFIRLLHLAGLWEVWGVYKTYDININPIIPYKEQYKCFTEWVYDVVKSLFEYDAVRIGLSHIFGYCLYNKIDLERHVIEKMKYNELRDNDKAY